MLDFSDCLLLDGGMGTMLQRAGLEPGQAPEKLNLTAPEAVEAVHRAYAAAGADILKIQFHDMIGTEKLLDN